jgi:general secretion pathway protein K
MRTPAATAGRRRAVSTATPGRARLGRGLRQRGAAVLMALVVATLATLIVSGLFWQQFVLLRTIENQQLIVQSRLLMSGALDWARAMLREDLLRSSHDGLDEFWAKGLAETRLDQLGESSTLAAQASIAGSMEDAQSRLNLRNLVGDDGQVVERELEALKRLCDLLGVPTVNAELIALRMQDAFAPESDADKAGRTAPTIRPLPPVLSTDIAAIPGVSAEASAALAPYLVVLDSNKTRLNVNTAAAEVLAAQIDISLARARAVVAQRERISHFVNVGNFRNSVGESGGAGAGDANIATTSSYFFVRGQIKLARADIRMEALVRRSAQPGSGPVEVLWQREL